MLSASPQERKKQYVVKNGYVYSDSRGNHYKPGETVYLLDKERDLAKHRLDLVKPAPDKVEPVKPWPPKPVDIGDNIEEDLGLYVNK